MIRTERVLEGPRSYSVTVGPGVRERVPAALLDVGAGRDLLLVTDANVAPLYADTLEAMLAETRDVRRLVLPAGESGKTREQLARIHDALAAAGTGRDVTVLALGGGVVSDVAGFAAATWMRGVPFAALPTTLLAMADASVGGKTAINIPAGKNLVGAFHQPRFVLADTDTLRSLPPEEMRSGLGEVVKTAVISDPDLFRRLEIDAAPILAGDTDVLGPIVATCVARKAAIVSRDEREAGERRLLNLGHTLGHALEAAAAYTGLRHGEAVSVGLAFAARLSVSLGRLAEPDADRIERLLRALRLPTRLPTGVSADALAAHIRLDKKVLGREPRWVLPVEIGRCEIDTVPDWIDRLARETELP